MKTYSLIVEKDRLIREQLSKLLQAEGHKVIAKENWVACQSVFEDDFGELLDLLFINIDEFEDQFSNVNETIEPYEYVKTVLVSSYSNSISHPCLNPDKGELLLVTENLQDNLSIILKQLYPQSEPTFTLRTSHEELVSPQNFIIGKSEVMRKLYSFADKVAPLPSTILITGPSGTGKELMARYLWKNSHLANNNFYTLDLAAIPDNLIESILFGHEKGSFTSAYIQKIGKFEIADGGTLFLDEIGTLKYELQGKLLRVIQEGQLERIGGMKTINIDVRLIAATNVNLKEEVRLGRFREDLYYRLNVIPVELPPLMERSEDIPEFVNYFVEKWNEKLAKNIPGISYDAMELLRKYSWPGNIRELENLIGRLVATISDGSHIELKDIPADYVTTEAILFDLESLTNIGRFSGDLRSIMVEFEKLVIIKALNAENNNKTKTAKRLGIPLSTLKFKIKKLSIKI